MDLDHIELNPDLVANLYSSHLIQQNVTADSATPKSSKKSIWTYIGNNEKNILLLVNYPGQAELNKQQQSFLNNMLAACKISLSDVAVMNFGQNPSADHKNLQEYFKSQIIILFDIEPSSFGLPLSFPHFQVQSFANCTFLFTTSIEELEKDKVLKSKLWVCLRRIFGI
ncbi:MAG TPA: hypothetical protein VHD35_04970 [Chitinophagaceae bacterium]|nr:hypothetical protein [Chitinophagaceae bacterium]